MTNFAKTSMFAAVLLFAVFSVAIADTPSTGKGRYVLVGWNDLGMHCVDGNDYSVFSILPPYNNLHAQLIDPYGKLVKTPTNIRLTYEAVADPTGSINRSSAGKTNFWQYAQKLFGLTVPLAPEMGLAGNAMPGTSNTPKPMTWQATSAQFVAEGIPITPYPDNPKVKGEKNYYPLMRLTARDSTNRVLATADVVLPVSDEMACANCHASGSKYSTAMPRQWVFDPDPNKDYKLNILALHDERHGTKLKASQPVLCAGCHASNALGTTKGTPLTEVLHKKHAAVIETGTTADREACYNCHPGSVTKCLRGAMGNAGMQCQNCHGSMAQVGATGRKGWIDEPGCGNCHTGTAVKFAGQIRQRDAFSYVGGPLRPPADPRFATASNALYKASAGHGGLACEACHGATHAEYPSSHVNDNLMVTRLQGHTGTLAECSTCHASLSRSSTAGPHGLHPLGAGWVNSHGDRVESQGYGACRDCHGGDLRGTVLSAALAPRSFSTERGTRTFAKGALIGCYNCHNGPNP